MDLTTIITWQKKDKLQSNNSSTITCKKNIPSQYTSLSYW